MSKLGLGIIGVGRHGSRYARHAAQDLDSVQLVAVSRRNQEAGQHLADTHDCLYLADPLELIEHPDIDVVVFATVPSDLPDLVSAACRQGKSLVVEKPVAPSLDEGLAMLEAIERPATFCMAGHTLRFNSVCAAIRDHLPRLGPIDSVVLTQRFPPQPQRSWLDDPAIAGGGNILHTGVHCFDLARWLTGLEIGTASCTTRRIRTKRTEDSFAAALTFRNSHALCQVSSSRTTDSRNGLIEVSGEKGQLLGDHVLGRLELISKGGAEPIELPPPAMTVLGLLERVAADVASGHPPWIPYRDGLAAVAVADACYRSAESGRTETVLEL